MQARSFLRRTDWSHLALVLVLAALATWYCLDAYGASARIENIILIVPASLVALVLCLYILLEIAQNAARGDARDHAGGQQAPAARMPLRRLDRLRPLLLMAVFGGYVLTMSIAGFDLATFVFLAIAMVLQGERRPWLVIGYSAAFALFVTFAAKWLLPYPMPTALF